MENYLYSLQPINVGTKDCESITSYMARIAEAHSVTLGSLISQIIAPDLHKEYLTQSTQFGGSRFYENSTSLLSIGKSVEDIVSLFETLTQIKGLYRLTTLPWRPLIATRNLIKKRRAWCPVCLENWRVQRKTIYEPLFWSLGVVRVCLEHNVELSSVCPRCGQENFLINRRSRVGFCNRCGCWLGSDINRVPVHLGGWERWVLNNVADLITISADIKNIGSFSEVLSIIIDKYFGGSQKALVRAIGIPLSSIRAWRHDVKPSLGNLLTVTYCLGLPIRDLLSSGKNYERRQFRKAIPSSTQLCCNRQPFEYERVKGLLEKNINDNNCPPSSLKRVAAELGYDKRVLYRYFPDHCHMISARYLNFVAGQRSQRIKKTCNNIAGIMDQLGCQGIYPSRRKIEFELGSSILREKALQIAWKTKLKNLSEYE